MRVRLLPLKLPLRLAAVGLIGALAWPASATGVDTGPYGPQIPANPYAAPPAAATQHGDTGASDTTPLPGPGVDGVLATPIALGATCPAILVGSDGYPVALCTQIANFTPRAYLLDPTTGLPLASLEVTKGSLLGGVYGYLDDQNRLVMVDGSNSLIRIAHTRTALGTWQMSVAERTPLGDHLAAGDAITSVSPDFAGRVWFATGHGRIGVVEGDQVRTLQLPDGEGVANGIATAPAGTAVTTTHALYLLDTDSSGVPQIQWRLPYNRGPARKPGQLSWGTGSTATFFGPETGEDYLAIVDNADPEVHLLVVPTDTGVPVCSVPVLAAGGPGSENSPIGAGRTVVVASTYGYPYPALPDDAGPSVPATADFEGGLTRVDVRADGSGCDVVWDTTTRSAAVPKLSTADQNITTITRERPVGGAGTTAADLFFYTVIDAATGAVLARQPVGITTASDTVQMAGNLAPGRVLYQGTLTGFVRIAPSPLP